MKPIVKQFGTIIISVIAAFAILGAAWWSKGTEHENAWLYVFCIWCVLFAAFEVYSKKKDKGQ